MRANKEIEKVVAALLAGVSIAPGGKRCRISTDGVSIFSYQMEILRKLPNGMFWVTTNRYSVTTGAHSDVVRRLILDAMAPNFPGCPLTLQWDTKAPRWNQVFVTSLTFETFKRDICGHGALDATTVEGVTRGEEATDPAHCHGNALFMQMCVASFHKEHPKYLTENTPKMKRKMSDRGDTWMSEGGWA